MIWTPDLHCLARFGDLFENAEDVWDEFVEAEVASNGFATFDYMNPAIKYQFIEDGPRNIYVRSAYLLNVSVGGQDVSSAPTSLRDQPHGAYRFLIVSPR